MGNFSNYWDLHTLFTKIKNKIKSVSDSIPTNLSDLTADTTHRTVTDTEKTTWNGKATSTDITNAINALDVSSVGGSGKYISAISETDGKISATATDIANINSLIYPYEAYLQWGGQNFTGSYGCIDAAMVSDLNANRFFGIRAAGITIEYTRDGGSTWTDYGASAFAKQTLFTSGTGFYIGKADGNNKATANGTKYQLRVTIDTAASNVYTELKKIVLYISTNGSNYCTCKVQGVLKENSSDTGFVDITSDVSISGWSGYNVINTSFVAGTSFNGQYRKVRFLFKANGGNTNYVGLNVQRIMAYGGVGWATPSTMARTGHLYEADSNLKATFPAELEATALYENGTALSSKYAANAPTFTEASIRANITSGETIPTILGKIKKFFTDLKAVAFTGSYNDLSNKPTIPTALSQLTADATHRLVTDTEKSTWNGKSNFSGSYNDLTNKPTIPTTASDVNAAPATDVPFKFGIDSSGNYGYIKAGADTVTPFKTVGTRSSNITANGTYTASTDISKDGYSSVTVAVPNSVQTKTVTPGTSQMYVTPDAGYIGLSQVTINVANNQQKSVSPTVAAQIVRPDTGYWLNSVTVDGIPTQEKTVTSSRSAQTVTPDSGRYLSKVTVNALAPTGTYTASSRGASLDMGATSNYRYVNTNGVPNSNSGTYTIPRSYGTKDLGATNSYRYVDPTDFGDWQYDVGYESGYDDGYDDRAPVTLWTNPSPGSEFAAKTITISNLKRYAYIFIIGRLLPNMSGYHSILGGFEPNNLGTTWAISDSKYGLSNANFALMGYGTIARLRFGYFNGSNQITIGNGVNLNAQDGSGSASSIGNGWFVPEKIIGVL